MYPERSRLSDQTINLLRGRESISRRYMWLEFDQSFGSSLDIRYSFPIGDEEGCCKPLKLCNTLVAHFVRYELNLLHVPGRCAGKSLQISFTKRSGNVCRPVAFASDRKVEEFIRPHRGQLIAKLE